MKLGCRKVASSALDFVGRPKWQDYSLSDIKIYSLEQWLQNLPLQPKSRNHIKMILMNLFN
ncbi:MAG: hypothetical protein ACM3JB_12685 [Acidobacteriaceae bacterium]